MYIFMYCDGDIHYGYVGGEGATGCGLRPECLENDVSKFFIFKLVLTSILWRELAVHGVTFVMS